MQLTRQEQHLQTTPLVVDLISLCPELTAEAQELAQLEKPLLQLQGLRLEKMILEDWIVGTAAKLLYLVHNKHQLLEHHHQLLPILV
jgi:hypothetical protein